MVAYRARKPVNEVAEILKMMDQKGLIGCNHRDKKRLHYSISNFVVIFYEGQVNRLDQHLVDLFEEYSPTFFQRPLERCTAAAHYNGKGVYPDHFRGDAVRSH